MLGQKLRRIGVIEPVSFHLKNDPGGAVQYDLVSEEVAKVYSQPAIRDQKARFGAGGGPDLLARALSPKLTELWGQPVTVENHPGAGSTAAPARVAESPADGYRLLVSTSAQAYSAALLKNLPTTR